MLVLPPGHAQAVRHQRSLRGVERALLAAAAALVVIVAVLLVALPGGSASRRGCISVALAYSTGGAQIDRCGAAARSLCAGVGVSGGITGQPARAVARACRRAGLPVG